MTIWEKAVLNMHKGSKKITSVAATVSERAKAEVAIIRLRIRIDEVRTRIDELHRLIGWKITDLNKREALPRTVELLLKDNEIAAAMTEIVDREQEVEELKLAVKDVQVEFRDTEKHAEDALS
jgi:predicted  nucleic acid-binding Zn-ribbon protein